MLVYLSSNDNIEPEFRRTLVVIFVIHNTVLCGILIGEHVACGGIGSAFGKVSVIGAAFCFVWALMGVQNLIKRN